MALWRWVAGRGAGGGVGPGEGGWELEAPDGRRPPIDRAMVRLEQKPSGTPARTLSVQPINSCPIIYLQDARMPRHDGFGFESVFFFFMFLIRFFVLYGRGHVDPGLKRVVW